MKSDVLAGGRPGREYVIAFGIGVLHDVVTGDAHDVNVLISVAIACEGNQVL